MLRVCDVWAEDTHLFEMLAAHARFLEVIELEYTGNSMYISVTGWKAMLDSWGASIDGALASLPALRAVVVYVDTWGQERAAIKEVLEVRLPLLRRRGVLRFSNVR